VHNLFKRIDFGLNRMSAGRYESQTRKRVWRERHKCRVVSIASRFRLSLSLRSKVPQRTSHYGTWRAVLICMDNQVSTRTLANLLGVSKKTISDLAKRGIIVPVGRGRYALEASVNSYCAYLREVGGRDRENAQPTQTKLKG
jgi:hypothetical protein